MRRRQQQAGTIDGTSTADDDIHPVGAIELIAVHESMYAVLSSTQEISSSLDVLAQTTARQAASLCVAAPRADCVLSFTDAAAGGNMHELFPLMPSCIAGTVPTNGDNTHVSERTRLLDETENWHARPLVDALQYSIEATITNYWFTQR